MMRALKILAALAYFCLYGYLWLRLAWAFFGPPRNSYHATSKAFHRMGEGTFYGWFR